MTRILATRMNMGNFKGIFSDFEYGAKDSVVSDFWYLQRVPSLIFYNRS